MADASVFELFARLALALAVVIGLMVLFARVLRRRGIDLTGGRRTVAPHQIELLGRRGLTRSASVALVRAGGRTLVLGVTEQQVTMLAEADPAAEHGDDEEAQWTELPVGASVGSPSGSPWKTVLETLREKTVRRD